ncbi:hypothetical protein Tco_0475056 [Tanacetum coccineum]
MMVNGICTSVDIGEEENELELTFPYEEADPLNPPSPASDSESDDVVEVENVVKPEDKLFCMERGFLSVSGRGGGRAELKTLVNNYGKPTKERVDLAMHSNVDSPKACTVLFDNATGNVPYAKLVNSELGRNIVNFRTLLALAGNCIGGRISR